MSLFFHLFGGVIFLAIGAELIVRSAVNLSNIYKISGYFIGFTIVALGTSLPELAATLQALGVLSSIDSVGIALGNVVGSNIANILLILGLVAIINPIVFPEDKGQVRQQYVGAGIVVIVGIALIMLWKFPAAKLIITLFSILLICVLVLVLFWQFNIEKKHNNQKEQFVETFPQFISYLLLFLGFILLIIGSYFFILGAQFSADKFGVSESIIGLTLVSFGTSLPELATGLVAAFKRQTGIAVGTILGSNIYNIVGVLFIIIMIKPEEFQGQNPWINPLTMSIVIMAIVTLLFSARVRFGLNIKLFGRAIKLKKNSVSWRTGSVFLFAYCLYTFLNYRIF